MDETVRAGRSDYLLIMDDDVQFDPEGILRAATFADLARRPTIVGGHMFSMYDRSMLHAFAEAVSPYTWWWGAAPNTKSRHDFGRRNLRNTPWLHRRADSDYNGWWMCLIPGGSSPSSASRCRSSSSGTTRNTGVRARDHGIPDGVDAGRGGLAGALGGQERRARLAGVLPPAQPDRHRAAALTGRPRRRSAFGVPATAAAEPAVHAVLDRGAAAAGHRGRAVRPGAPAPRDRDQDGAAAGAPRADFTDARGEADLESFPRPAGERPTS